MAKRTKIKIKNSNKNVQSKKTEIAKTFSS